ncbi:hypothetical protein AgCh_033696 [Apium graveolens]
MNPSILSKAEPGEPLFLYIVVGPRAISVALIRKEKGTQIPVYYVSQVLKDAKTRYPNLEKFALALVHASWKQRQYFQGREIKVVRYQPLRKIIHKPDASERLVNWAIELSQFNIIFVPRTEIKAQALAEFVMEYTFPEFSSIMTAPTIVEDEPHNKNASSLENWMTPFIVYLKHGTLLEHKNKASYLKHKATCFFLEEDQFYRRTFSAPTLRCVDPDEADYCLQEDIPTTRGQLDTSYHDERPSVHVPKFTNAQDEKKIVAKLEIFGEKDKKRALQVVSSLSGIDSISIDMKDRKLTVIGVVDPVVLVNKLRKLYYTELLSIAPHNKEAERKKEDDKKKEVKEDDKKEEVKEDDKKKEVVNKVYEKMKEVINKEDKKKDDKDENIQEIIKTYHNLLEMYMKILDLYSESKYEEV